MSVTSPAHLHPAVILLDSDDEEQAGPSGRPAQPHPRKPATTARAQRTPGGGQLERACNRQPEERPCGESDETMELVLGAIEKK
ncbi:hypothetical protein WJX75_001926 [Coccomyxa subellipsoidea]|uniref:Uncharacterized protein n=1 Tax=Coccomyxa subellipsoidea TaxID=248742 RepID=A0ABR2YZ86_9CHLO